YLQREGHGLQEGDPAGLSIQGNAVADHGAGEAVKESSIGIMVEWMRWRPRAAQGRHRCDRAAPVPWPHPELLPGRPRAMQTEVGHANDRRPGYAIDRSYPRSRPIPFRSELLAYK